MGGWVRDGDQCVACPIGTFHDVENGAETYQSCREGSTTTEPGSTECSKYQQIMECQ